MESIHKKLLKKKNVKNKIIPVTRYLYLNNLEQQFKPFRHLAMAFIVF